MDITTMGAAMILLDKAARNANAAATLANTKAGLANTAAGAANAAAGAANAAAAGANAFATQYFDINADVRLLYSQFQAHIRYLEKRVTTLESQVSAMAGH